MRYLLIAIACTLVAANALAEESSSPNAAKVQPLSTSNFIPLKAARMLVQNKSAQFIALPVNNFKASGLRPALPVKHEAVASQLDMPSVQEISARSEVHKVSGHGMMSNEQAQQILSIFDPAN